MTAETIVLSAAPSVRRFVVRHGAGIPVIAMHGGPGLDHTYLRPGLDDLGDVAELVYYDQTGNGRSARPQDWDAVTHDTWVEEVEDLRRELGFEAFVLFGHSYGGFLAQEYALRYGARLKGLILCSTAAALDYPDVAMARAQTFGTPEAVAALASALSGPIADDESLRGFLNAVPSIYYHQPPPALPALYRDMHLSAAAFNRAFFHCLPHFRTLESLANVQTPTLILTGRYDWIAPPEQGAQRMQHVLTRSELVILEQSGHYPFLEEPERFRAVVRDWLARLA
jgi:proline iminopeptidase